MMLKQWKIWFAFVLVSFFFYGGQGMARPATRISNEAYIVALVNQIRLDPLGYAEGLGYNRQALFQQLPWLSTAAYGLNPVSVSDFLNHQATALNSEDPSVVEPTPTIKTDYAIVGDINGVVSFYNFMDPFKAIDIIINNQVTKELDPAYDGKRIILSPDYKLLGIAFRAGRIQMENGLQNAFFLYTCFSSSLLTSEVQVVNMINQVRANPSEAYKYLPVNLGFLPGGYGPLFFNDALASTAWKALSAEVDVLAHALNFEFPEPIVAYTAVVETFPKADANTLAMWIFSSLMIRETIAYPLRDVIFSPSWNNAGPALFAVGNESSAFLKLTLVSGQTDKADPKISRIYGVAFTDTDLSGLYTPGEDAADRVISVYDNRTGTRVQTVVTNKAGQFNLYLPNNSEYNIQTGRDENRSGRLIFLTTDQYLNLMVK